MIVTHDGNKIAAQIRDLLTKGCIVDARLYGCVGRVIGMIGESSVIRVKFRRGTGGRGLVGGDPIELVQSNDRWILKHPGI